MSALTASIVRPQAGNHAFVAEIVPAGELLYLVGGTHHEPTLLATSDAAHFYKQKTPNKPGLRSFLVLGTSMYVCGEYGGLFQSTDGGQSWDEIETDTNACLFALGRDRDGGIWVCGDEGFVMRSEDGDDWEEIDLDTSARVQNVYADDDCVYFTCGDGALIAWKDETATTLFRGTAALTDIQRTKHGLFVSGDEGQLWHSSDGKTFERLAIVSKDVDLEAITVGQGGIFVVGSKGTILHSLDGVTFDFVACDSRAHFYAVTASGAGAFVGGEGGALVHVKTADDTTWADKADTLAEVAGELDAFFREASPDEFLTVGLPKLLNVPAPTLAPDADFEAIWGTKLPDEINAFNQLIANDVGRALYEWRPENELLPNLPSDENLFEWIVLRDQEAYLGTGLPEIMCGQICLGSYGNGDTHHASIYGEDDFEDRGSTPAGPRMMHIFDHEEHYFALETATSVARMAYFSALFQAWSNEKVGDGAASECFDRLRGHIHPSWHFASGIKEAGFAKFEDFEAKPYARVWYARGVWLMYLLRSDGVVDVEDVKRMFHANQNPILDGDVHARWSKSAQRFVPTALYCLLRCFYFDDPKLGEYLQIARNHKSRIVRDAASLVEDTLAGKRKALGKIPDWLAQRARFQKLDLDPAREAARQAEAAERAAAAERERAAARERIESAIAKGGSPADFAWDALDDVNIHEVVETALRQMPALAGTFRSLDFILNQGWSRENLSLSHEKNEEIEWLGRSGDPSVVPLLLGTLLRPQQEHRKPNPIWAAHPNMAGEILEAFAEAGRVDARAIPALRTLLDVEEKYEFRRARAVELLGHLRDVDSLPALLKLAETLPTSGFADAIKKKELTIAMARTLGRLGDARAIPMLRTLVSANQDWTKDCRSWAGVSLARLGAVDAWEDVLVAATSLDRKPTTWLLWALGLLGAKADDAKKQKIIAELTQFKPKWSAPVIELVRAGVLTLLGAGPDDFADTLAKGLTQPAWDDKATDFQHEWAIRLIGAMDVSTAPVKPFLLRDHAVLRRAAREALTQRGQAVPPAKLLARAEIARLEAEGGAAAILAAFEDETAIFKHVAAARLAELGATQARPALIRHARAILATALPEVGFKLSYDLGYPLRWTLKALLDLGPTPELVALLADVLEHPSRDVKDPALRYAKVLPDDPGLIVPMMRVADAKWGWQESTANAWLDEAKKKHAAEYDAALAKLRT